MKKIALAASALALAAAAPASADILYNVNGSFTADSLPAGTLTGSFTTDDARSSVLSFNLVASASGAFTGFTYTPATAPVSASSLPSQFFQLNAAGGLGELRLFFSAGGLGQSGATLDAGQSYEFEPSGGSRFLSGSVTAAAQPAGVPEPSSWGLLLAGFGLVGAGLRARRRPATTFA